MGTNAIVSSEHGSATMIALSHDRITFVPQHVGPTVLPNNSLFARILNLAHREPQRTAIRDVILGVEKTHVELLTDVLALQEIVQNSLSAETLALLQSGQEIYIGILAPGGYEYAVALLTVLALGAAAVPICT